MLARAFNKSFYMLTYVICYVIDLTMDIFESLMGLDSVNTEDGNKNIIDEILDMEWMKTAFWIIVAIAFFVLVVITVISLLKAYRAENPLAESKEVLTHTATSLLGFVLIPVAFTLILMILPVVMGAIQNAMGVQGTSLGGTLIANEAGIFKDAGLKYDALVIEGKYWISDLNSYGVDWENFNNFSILIAAGPIALSLFYCIYLLVRRIFSILALYIASPFVLSLSPSDDGYAFKKWRESMISQLLSVIAMLMLVNIFKMICSSIDGMTFTGDDVNDSGNNLVQGLIKAGGAIAIAVGAEFVNKMLNKNNGSIKSFFDKKQILKTKNTNNSSISLSASGKVMAYGGVSPQRKAYLDKQSREMAARLRGAAKTTVNNRTSISMAQRLQGAERLSAPHTTQLSSNNYKLSKNNIKIQKILSGNKDYKKPKINLKKEGENK